MSVNAWLCEAKGIQRYLTDSGPLRDLIGASDLVSGLAASDGDDAIGAIVDALKASVRYSRRAGGAFCLHSDSADDLARIRDLWLLTIGLHCPGLEIAESNIVQGENDLDAINKAFANLGGLRRNSAAELPPTGGPLTAFNPRTGRLVTKLYAHRGGDDLVETDVLTEAHRGRAEALKDALQGDRVADKFLDPNVGRNMRPVFPRNFQRDNDDYEDNPIFPFEGDDQRIAVVHADLSGLGQIFRAATDPGPGAPDRRNGESIRAIAEAIEKVVVESARTATEQICLKAARQAVYKDSKNQNDKIDLNLIPARPVLLGGDDVTIIVRPDLAAPFTETLLLELETRSQEALKAFSDWNLTLPTKLSACAGIAVIRSNQPLQMAMSLAESLCKFAKTYAKFEHPESNSPVRRDWRVGFPSYVAFHVSQSTLREDYETIRARETTVVNSFDTGWNRLYPAIHRSGNPYLVGDGDDGRASFSALLSLAKTFRTAPRGRSKLMRMGREIKRSPLSAAQSYRRWREMLKTDYPDDVDDVISALNAAGFGAQHEATLLGFEDPGRTAETLGMDSRKAFGRFLGPVLDALEWIDLGFGREPEKKDSEQ